MTARAETTVLVDAATVYSEGVLAGLRTASAIVGRTDDAFASHLATALLAAKALPRGEARDTIVASLDLLRPVAPPLKLQALVREWRATVYHNQWLAERGTPAPCPSAPSRDQLLSRIHAFLMTFPDTDHD